MQRPWGYNILAMIPCPQHLSPVLPSASGCLLPSVSPALALSLLELDSGKYFSFWSDKAQNPHGKLEGLYLFFFFFLPADFISWTVTSTVTSCVSQ